MLYVSAEENLHDRIISLRGEVWASKTSLTPLLCQTRKLSGHIQSHV